MNVRIQTSISLMVRHQLYPYGTHSNNTIKRGLSECIFELLKGKKSCKKNNPAILLEVSISYMLTIQKYTCILLLGSGDVLKFCNRQLSAHQQAAADVFAQVCAST